MTISQRISTHTAEIRTEDGDLFDDSAGYDDDAGIRMASGLSALDRRRATILYNFFNELWGLILVKGDPGVGKDLFGNYLQYNLKAWFPWKRILRDEKPRQLFGTYAGLFNEEVIHKDLQNMANIAKGVKSSELGGLMDKVANDWVKGAGEVLLKNSVLYLTEYWRYCYNREPHSPMNKTMGAIQKLKRHLDVLIIGTSQLTTDLDKKTSLPWVDWRVSCSRSIANPTGFSYLIERVKYERRLDMLLALPRVPLRITFDAGKPRSNMGDGRIVIKKPKYEPVTDEERIVLYVLKEGCDNYEEMVELLETKGDMTEDETLLTLKDLGLRLPGRRPKFVVWYPCDLHLFNSKSAPQLRTALKVDN